MFARRLLLTAKILFDSLARYLSLSISLFGTMHVLHPTTINRLTCTCDVTATSLSIFLSISFFLSFFLTLSLSFLLSLSHTLRWVSFIRYSLVDGCLRLYTLSGFCALSLYVFTIPNRLHEWRGWVLMPNNNSICSFHLSHCTKRSTNTVTMKTSHMRQILNFYGMFTLASINFGYKNMHFSINFEFCFVLKLSTAKMHI